MLKAFLGKASGAAASAAAILPGSSLRFGPPRRIATTRTAGQDAVTRKDLFPERRINRPVAELADPPLAELMMKSTPGIIREIFVAALSQGRYWGRYHGYIIDRNDTLLTDLSPTFTLPNEPHDGLRQLRLPPAQRVRGTVAVINTPYADNFHHWLLDTLPRFEWLRRAGYAWKDIDYFILPQNILRHHTESLKLLGIDPAKVIHSTKDTHIEADLLLAPSHSEPSSDHWVYDYTPEGLQFVRDLFLKDNPYLGNSTPKRFIVSRERAAARRLVQNERATQLLAEMGFAKIFLEDYSVREQAALAQNAECIVMPTGGNLANFVFCQPGTIAVELFCVSYTPNFTHVFMGPIGLRYYGLVTEILTLPFPTAIAGELDIDFDPDRLAAIVRDALARPGPTGT